jgi:hypothetical protein
MDVGVKRKPRRRIDALLFGKLGFTWTPKEQEDENTPAVPDEFKDAYNIDPINEVVP